MDINDILELIKEKNGNFGNLISNFGKGCLFGALVGGGISLVNSIFQKTENEESCDALKKYKNIEYDEIIYNLFGELIKYHKISLDIELLIHDLISQVDHLLYMRNNKKKIKITLITDYTEKIKIILKKLNEYMINHIKYMKELEYKYETMSKNEINADPDYKMYVHWKIVVCPNLDFSSYGRCIRKINERLIILSNDIIKKWNNNIYLGE